MPLGLHYDVSQVETGDGQETVRVLFTAQSSDAIVYVTVSITNLLLTFITHIIIIIIIIIPVNNKRERKEKIRQIQ